MSKLILIESEVLKKVTTAMGTVKGFATFTFGVACKNGKDDKIAATVRVVCGGTQISYMFFVDKPTDYEELVNEDKVLVPYCEFSVDSTSFIETANTLANYGEAVFITYEDAGTDIAISAAQAAVKLPLIEEDKIPLPLPSNYAEGYAMVTIDTKGFLSMARKGASMCSDKDGADIGKIKSFSLIGTDKLVVRSTNTYALQKAECAVTVQYATPNLANAGLEEKIASLKGDEAKALSEKKANVTDQKALLELAEAEKIPLDSLDFCLNATAFDIVKSAIGIDNVTKFQMIVTKNYLHVAAGSCMCTVTLANKLTTNIYAVIDKFVADKKYLEVTVDASRLLNDLAVLGLCRDDGIGVNIKYNSDGLEFTRSSSKVHTPVVNSAGEMDLNVYFNISFLREVVSVLDKGNITLRFLGNVNPVIVRNGDVGGAFDSLGLVMALNPEVMKKKENEKSEAEKSKTE